MRSPPTTIEASHKCWFDLAAKPRSNEYLWQLSSYQLINNRRRALKMQMQQLIEANKKCVERGITNVNFYWFNQISSWSQRVFAYGRLMPKQHKMLRNARNSLRKWRKVWVRRRKKYGTVASFKAWEMMNALMQQPEKQRLCEWEVNSFS